MNLSTESKVEEPVVFCRRIRGFRALTMHLSCPYCFGGDRYESFCDFQPGVDPLHFGFPETHGRHVNA